MRGKRVPPKELVKARIRDLNKWGGRALNCGHCGQRLPDISCYPNVPPERLAQREPGFELSPNQCYIKHEDLAGWIFDGDTLRPTDYHKESTRRTRKQVRSVPVTTTRRERRLLAGRPPQTEPFRAKRLARTIPVERLMSERRQRPPSMRPAPQYIECIQCEAKNQILVELTAQGAVE